jgi:hypothetical protein
MIISLKPAFIGMLLGACDHVPFRDKPMPRIEMNQFGGGEDRARSGLHAGPGIAQPNMECSFNGSIPVDAGEILKIRINLIWINVVATEIQ